MSEHTAEKVSDLDLIRATIRRREKGGNGFPEFREFLERYETKLRGRIAPKLNYDLSLVEDVLQQAMYKFFRAGLKENYRHSPWAYYQTVVKTCMLDARDRAKKHRHDPLDKLMPDGTSTPREDKNAPKADKVLSAARYRRSLKPVLDEAFHRLVAKSPGKLHTVKIINMRFIDGRSVKDIACETGNQRPNTVTKIIKRTLKELQQVLNIMHKEGFPGTDLVFETMGIG